MRRFKMPTRAPSATAVMPWRGGDSPKRNDEVRLIEKPLRLPAIELPALLINLNAPDGTIRDQLEEALRAGRAKYPPPVRKRGPQALNARFGDQKFYMWRRYKILQLADLLAWRNGQKDKITAAQMGRWLGFDEGRTAKESAKEVELAKKTLEEALRSIPALAAQAATEHAI